MPDVSAGLPQHNPKALEKFGLEKSSALLSNTEMIADAHDMQSV